MEFSSKLNNIPPQEIEAEMNILGGILMDVQAMEICKAIIEPQAFYTKAHQLIYSALWNLHEEGKGTDLITLASSLKDNDLLEKVGGRRYLLGLVEQTISTVNIDNLCHLVKDKYIRRLISKVGLEIAESGYDTEIPLEEILREVKAKTALLEDNSNNFQPTRIDYVLSDLLENLENISESGSKSRPTEYIDLDNLLCGGFNPGELIVIAGRPAMGKSAFSMTIALSMAKKEMPSIVFSLEMPKEQIASRFLSQELKINNRRFQMGVLEEDLVSIISGIGIMNNLPLWIDDNPYINLAQIKSRSKQIFERMGESGCIVIDYLQLMSELDESNNRVQAISKVTRQLKLMARDLQCPIILLSQLNRDVESRQNKRPMLSDLRDSGSIEQDSDIAIFLYREEYYNPTTVDKGIAEVHVAKNRRGETGTIKMLFDGELTQFKNLTSF